VVSIPSSFLGPAAAAGAAYAGFPVCVDATLAFAFEWPLKTECGELAQLVTNHVLGNVDRHVLLAVVHRDRQPTKSGRIVERRDQVLMGRLSLMRARPRPWHQMVVDEGPFLTERAMLFYLVMRR
jgi:hypothetical protein